MTNRKVTLVLAATTTILCFAATTAHADETSPSSPTAPDAAGSSDAAFRPSGGRFGEAGQWVYSITSADEFPFRLTKTGGSSWDLVLRPGADTFISRNVSVGGIVTLASNGGGSDIGIGARAGYNVSLTSLVSIWIRGGLYFHHTSVNNGPRDSQTVMDLTVPFVFHFVPHFLAGVGPMFHLPIQQTGTDNKDATFGLTAIVGGWL
jgi:hypothetical protein